MIRVLWAPWPPHTPFFASDMAKSTCSARPDGVLDVQHKKHMVKKAFTANIKQYASHA